MRNTHLINTLIGRTDNNNNQSNNNEIILQSGNDARWFDDN